jgi:small-conductance mechanosensitive channel
MLGLETRNLVSVAAIIAAGLVVSLLTGRGLKYLSRRSDMAAPLVRVLRIYIRWTLAAVVLLLVFQELGVLKNVWTAFLAIAAMIAVGFVAVWSVLSNALCTLLILIYKPFRIGDLVEITSDNLKGEVIDLNLMFTTLRDDKDYLIQVPNNYFFQKAIRLKKGKDEVSLYDQFLKP